MHKTLPHRTPIAPTGNYASPGAQMPILMKSLRTGRPATAATVFSKILAPALLTACLWSKIWIGPAAAIALCAAVLVLLVFAPKRFSTTVRGFDWARQVGYGEKIWLNRIFVPVPQALNYRLTTLYLVFWAGMLVALWGAIASLPLLSGTGLAVAYSAQASCFRKLIHLYTVMRDQYPLYRFWAASPVNDNSAHAAARRESDRRSA